MRTKLIIIFIILLIFSCKDEKQTEKQVKKRVEKLNLKAKNEKKETVYPITTKKDIIEQSEKIDCNKFFKNIFPKDSLKEKLINEILLKNKGLLTKNNLTFLRALVSENKTDLAFNKVLFPIFRLSENEIGVFTYSNSKPEIRLINKFDTIQENVEKNIGAVIFYPQLLNYVFNGETRPDIKYYSKDRIGITKIKELGIFLDACLEYFEYSIDTIDISINDKLLFGSKYDIDLIFENNPFIDSLIQNSVIDDCLDCPNSMKKQKTFARLYGTKNLYFVFADTFPINNKLLTPSRALILVNENNEIIYFWYDEIDLFGCSCL